jgi:Lon-like protease
VVSTTRATYTFPFNISIEVGAVGGPSAGLALTLGILDILSGGDLTGGHSVAATGTIELDGTVGDVGGVAQKTVAVRRAGATVFFVPADQFKDAQSQAGSMKVYAVKSLQQALDDLQRLGGQVPPPSGSNGV